MGDTEILPRFLLQIAVVLGACGVFGWLLGRIGQPRVMGEMIAGIALGPSLLGLLWPGLEQRLFPKEVLGVTYAVSQLGLTLYMFLVGMGFETGLLRRRGRGAASVSLVGIVVPFVLGGVLARALAGDPRYFAVTVRPLHAVLFLGAAMSVTAFPVLARIIEERGLLGTAIGTLALAAASIDDAAAWCLLAVTLAGLDGEATIALRALLGAVAYAAATWFLLRPLLRRLGEEAERERRVGGSLVSFVLILLLTGAWFTHEAGLHAVFGAFVLGLAVPRGVVATELSRRLKSLTTHLLLPLFFAYSGLHTTIGLLDTPGLWGVASLVLLAACLGKGVACAAVARLTGETSREALAVGALMNARGLMELIILNIGLERGLITGTLFTIMVMMALATTLMASPLFDLAYRLRSRPGPSLPRGSAARWGGSG